MSPEDYDKDILDPEDGSINLPHLIAQTCHLYVPTPDMTEEELKAIEEANAYWEKHAASEIPVMWDRPYVATDRLSHQNSEDEDSPGGNVLYLDGHVDFVKFGEKFPMTETMARLLDERPRESLPDCEE